MEELLLLSPPRQHCRNKRGSPVIHLQVLDLIKKWADDEQKCKKAKDSGEEEGASGGDLAHSCVAHCALVEHVV
jgi:hypothetical protein